MRFYIVVLSKITVTQVSLVLMQLSVMGAVSEVVVL